MEVPVTAANVDDLAFRAVNSIPLEDAVCNDADRLLKVEVASAKPKREGMAAML